MLVKTLVNSGINAPAMVPQLMMMESAHHKSAYCPVKIAEQNITGNEGNGDGNDRGDPNQIGQRMFKVKFFLAGKERLC